MPTCFELFQVFSRIVKVIMSQLSMLLILLLQNLIMQIYFIPSQWMNKHAIFQMNPDKSPGLDGFNPTFFQKFWNLIGDEIFRAGYNWLHPMEILPFVNDTNIVLVLKYENPVTMKDLRPISLCNAIYKIISKVLANRLKKVLPKIISPYQSAFVSGRAIVENVLMAFELIHSIKRNTRVKLGAVALKIDISKAYDRVDWGFLKLVLLKMGFSTRWVDWMMMCVSTVKYFVVMNNQLVGHIQPQRGLRQGNPLSLFIYSLCRMTLCSYQKSRVVR